MIVEVINLNKSFLNNKGFAISTILFSVLIVFLSVLAVSYATLASNPDKKDEKCPEGCNNDKCICPKPPEESIGCDSFRDFSCPNEFSIGTEKFCLLYTNLQAIYKRYLPFSSFFVFLQSSCKEV